MTVDEALSVILAEGSRLDIKAVSIGTIVEACQEAYGICPIKTIGMQPGENMHETLDGVVFSNQVAQYTKDEFKEKFLCPSE
jgi:FlaA1/EpsC-like NDP-sugar epimerase